MLYIGTELVVIKNELFSSGMEEDEAPDVLCHLENVQGLVDALTAVRWKRHQDAVVELSEHGIVLIVEESGCLQAKVYLKREVLSMPISSLFIYWYFLSRDSCIVYVFAVVHSL